MTHFRGYRSYIDSATESQSDSTNVSPLVDLQSLSLTQLESSVYSEININVLTNLLNKSLTQYGTLTSISISPDVNVLNLALSQLESTIYLETNVNVLVNQLNKTFSQLNASYSYSALKEIDKLELSSNQLGSFVRIDDVIDLNLLSLNINSPSASILIDPNVYLNLNILQQQMLINSITLGIVNRILFPIVDGVDYFFEFKDDNSSIRKGLDKVYDGEPFKGGLDKTHNPTSLTSGLTRTSGDRESVKGGLDKTHSSSIFIKGIEITKR